MKNWVFSLIFFFLYHTLNFMMSAESTKKNLFDADDWGFSPAINEGILSLAENGWLNSASCTANIPHLGHRLEDLLRASTTGPGLSLHFNLTYGKPLSRLTRASWLIDTHSGHFFPQKTLLKNLLLGKVSQEAVGEEFYKQLQQLITLGVPVSSINGHQHIHLLPGITATIRAALRATGGPYKLRVMTDTSHKMSFLLTQFFKTFLHQPNDVFTLVPCHYLQNHHLRSEKEFFAKLTSSNGIPLLTHPALHDDFQQSGMTDPLQANRIYQLRMILKYLSR